MSYLYALMGIAMISGIASMIEISNSLNKDGLQSSPPSDPYFKSDSIASNSDRIFIKALLNKGDEDWPEGKDFCTELKDKAIKISTIAANYSVSERSISEHPRLLNSCTLISSNHRIIISYKKNNIKDYGLYSCINEKKYYCDFED